MEVLFFIAFTLLVMLMAERIMYFYEKREREKWLKWLAEFEPSKDNSKKFFDNLTDEQRESIGLKGEKE